EIMRLFITREAVDRHFALAFPIVSPKSTMGERLSALAKAVPFYALWYPRLWLPVLRSCREFGALAGHVRYVAGTTKRLGRALFHAMVRFGPGLEKRQMVLFRAVDIGAELYAMTAVCARAAMLSRAGPPATAHAAGAPLVADAAGATPRDPEAGPGAVERADAFCRLS